MIGAVRRAAIAEKTFSWGDSQPGLDHERLTFLCNGVPRRRTNVEGNGIREILAEDPWQVSVAAVVASRTPQRAPRAWRADSFW